MSPDEVAGSSGGLGYEFVSFSVRGWCGFGECGGSAESGEGGWSVGSLGGHILTGSTTVTHGMGGSTDGRKGSFGGEIESVVGRVAGTWHGKRPLGEGVGEGVFLVFLVWTSGTWGELMFTSGHFFSIFATRVIGGCSKWPISGNTD